MMISEIPPAVLRLLAFLSTYRDGLTYAAILLGGPIAGQRVHRLLDALSSQPLITRRVGRELVALHRLLSLADVADYERPEAYYFSLIDPTDPAVADICLMTDSLTDCLKALIVEDLVQSTDFDLAA